MDQQYIRKCHFLYACVTKQNDVRRMQRAIIYIQTVIVNTESILIKDSVCKTSWSSHVDVEGVSWWKSSRYYKHNVEED